MEKYIYEEFVNALEERKKVIPLTVVSEDGFVVNSRDFIKFDHIPCEVENEMIRLYATKVMLKCIQVRQVNECCECLRYHTCPYVSDKYREAKSKIDIFGLKGFKNDKRTSY